MSESLCMYFCRKNIVMNYNSIINIFKGQKILVYKILNNEKIAIVIELTTTDNHKEIYTINEYQYDITEKINNCTTLFPYHVHGNIKDHLNIMVDPNDIIFINDLNIHN